MIFAAYAIAANLAFLLSATVVLAMIPDGWPVMLWLLATLWAMHWVNHRWVYPLA